MPNEHKSGPSKLASSIEISKLVQAHGITRDQARRLINKFGNNRVKLSEAAGILKARLAARAKPRSEHDWRSAMAKAEASVEELVGMIERGELQLPKAQRRFLWRATRVRELLVSLYRGYPSGAILLW